MSNLRTCHTQFSNSFTVLPEESGVRLDKFLQSKLSNLTRTRIQSLIKENNVSVNGKASGESSYKVKSDDKIEVTIPLPKETSIPKADIKLNVLYEDNHIIVINKPAGITVHPGAGTRDDTLVNALLHHTSGSLSGIGGVLRPGIVHRLDRDTSGLMVVAKTDQAHQHLAKQLGSRALKRIYHAIVWGVPKPPNGTITANIGRSPINRKRMAVMRNGGKSAITHYALLKILASGALSLVECRLETGRTHQIRVHMSHIGHSLVGDKIYGNNKRKSINISSPIVKNFPRQALHAISIGFYHPESEEYLEFTSEYSHDFKELLEKI